MSGRKVTSDFDTHAVEAAVDDIAASVLQRERAALVVERYLLQPRHKSPVHTQCDFMVGRVGIELFDERGHQTQVIGRIDMTARQPRIFGGDCLKQSEDYATLRDQ